MIPKAWISGICKVAGGVLLTTALLKLSTAIDSSRIMDLKDTITGVENRTLIWIAGAVEWIGGLYLVFGRAQEMKGAIGLWFGSIFLAYRLLSEAAVKAGAPKGCPCLGFAGNWLPVSERTQQTYLLIFAGSLVIAGLLILVTSWTEKKQIVKG